MAGGLLHCSRGAKGPGRQDSRVPSPGRQHRSALPRSDPARYDCHPPRGGTVRRHPPSPSGCVARHPCMRPSHPLDASSLPPSLPACQALYRCRTGRPPPRALGRPPPQQPPPGSPTRTFWCWPPARTAVSSSRPGLTARSGHTCLLAPCSRPSCRGCSGRGRGRRPGEAAHC